MAHKPEQAMDLIKLKMPATFITERVKVSWRDVQFGLVNELLDPVGAVDIAIEQLARSNASPGALVELASAAYGFGSAQTRQELDDLVDRLAASEPRQTDEEIRERWLYLTLAWIHEHRDEYPRPLETLAEVYADFDYPRQIANLVYYMPMDGPGLGSRAANEQRILERWRQYLDDAARALGSPR